MIKSYFVNNSIVSMKSGSSNSYLFPDKIHQSEFNTDALKSPLKLRDDPTCFLQKKQWKLWCSSRRCAMFVTIWVRKVVL